jgi:ketosteroid isomerase-like protein
MKVAAERLPIDAFVEALGRLDFAALAETMADDVTFRALVPPGFREARGSVAAAEMIGGWFEDARDAVLVRSASGRVGDRVFADYRIRVIVDGEPMVAEQKAVATVAGGKIATLDFMCSGFHPATE